MRQRIKLTALDITLIGLMIAVIEVSKLLMKDIPNIELTSFWVIMFTLYFKGRVFFVIPAFVLIEGLLFGFGIWWIMYLYAWPILALITYFFRKMESAFFWSILSCVYGLLFGFLGSFVYVLTSGFPAAFAWWIAGIPWDVVHGVGNFVLMFVLYRPIQTVMKRISILS